MQRESSFDRTMWTIALTVAVLVVTVIFARQSLFGGDGEAAGFSPPLTLWVAGPQTGGQAEAVAQQAATCWESSGRPVTVATLPGSSATAVTDFMDRVHRAPGDLLLLTSTTLSDIAHDSASTPSSAAGERAQRAVRLLAGAAPVAVLGSETLSLAVRASSPIHSTARLLSLMRSQPSRLLLGVAESTWLEGNLASLARGAELHGQIPYSVFHSSREAVVSLDAGEVEVVVAPHSALRDELRSGRLRELPWPTPHEPAPRAWVALVAPSGLSPAEIAALRSQAHHLCSAATWTRLLRSDGLSPADPSKPQLEDFMHEDIREAGSLQALAASIVRNY